MTMCRALTETQFEVFSQFGAETGWLRPMDLGGRNGSNHSAVLAALERRGLVESRQRRGAPGYRGSKVYRLTLAGRTELDRAQTEGTRA